MHALWKWPSSFILIWLIFVCHADEFPCQWKDCGFCSVESAAELGRHLFFHCYHTKLKQWGQSVLQAHPDIGSCSVGLQNRNIIPEITDNFICLWEHCEVSSKPPGSQFWLLDQSTWFCLVLVGWHNLYQYIMWDLENVSIHTGQEVIQLLHLMQHNITTQLLLTDLNSAYEIYLARYGFLLFILSITL